MGRGKRKKEKPIAYPIPKTDKEKRETPTEKDSNHDKY